ncbi:hypothetical protein PE36_19225 [Moritella sp. PE36]|nr:hypothetical protein PE36_19225 [Moritella sp. PE36]
MKLALRCAIILEPICIKTKTYNQITLSCRFIEGVKQELWGVLIAYKLIRLEIASIAAEAKVDLQSN